MPRARVGWLEVALGALVAASAVLEFRLLFTLNVNWDEFHFLSRIYELRRDALPERLQTFHVHLFGWLSLVASHEVDQIFAARTALFGLGIGSRALVYAIARRFVGIPAALVATLSYSSFSYVLHHGASFRFDPMLGFLCLLATWLLLAHPASIPRSAAAGLAIALSSMISLKTAFQLPVIASVLAFEAVRSGRGFARLLQGLAFGTAFVFGFVALYALHASLVSSPTGAGSGAFLERVATSFLASELFPRAAYFTQSLAWDGPIWLLFGLGFGLVLSRVVRGDGREARRTAALLLGFAVPLASLAAYRNAFPYFYVFIVAPAIVLCGVPVDALAARLRGRPGLRSAAVLAIALVVFSGALRFAWAHRADETLAQRELIELVHELFPVATPYIDRCAMIATYPKVGMFISKWGLADYHAAGRPVFEALIRAERPPFVLANVAALNVTPEMVAKTPLREQLSEADRFAIRENYIWHWSKLAVAGKSFAFARGDGPRKFRMLLPGTYTVEASAPVKLDGAVATPRSQVRLEEGVHTIAPVSTPARVSLRWGTNLRRPQTKPVDQSIFTGFLYGEPDDG